jgi:hypothetical protein
MPADVTYGRWVTIRFTCSLSLAPGISSCYYPPASAYPENAHACIVDIPPRSPAQIEAARHNGSKARGPVTPEGKARSAMNALKHGLTSPEHILLEGEDEAAFTDLHRRLIEENEPENPTEASLVHRLAVTFWKQARADRLEAKLFANTAPPRFITSEGIEPGDPEAFFDLKRFNAIRGYQAQLSREVSRCLGELRRLKATRSTVPANDNAEKEPEPALSQAARSPNAALRNEPEESRPPAPFPNRRERRRRAALMRSQGQRVGHAASDGSRG